ncbi:hypothetical protein [Akkermansia massiliensis]|uniref:hypothetical protein n=1 Tax=Akkermansia massiliensis TaxID=2927224 RepID=UPI00202DC077|nr:hypothetical protein [Akkermansia sp. B2-R-115]MCM0686174.1 hypothetical protein [Akkermansia sp. B2-R-115]
MQEIHLQFPTLGDWQKLTLTAIYQDAEGYAHTDRYTQDDIPADQAPALSSVVSALVGMAEPWQASQVWARLGHVTALAPDDPFEPAEIEIEAINPQGGRRTFTTADYPEFTLTTLPVVAFFKHFTTNK